MRNQPSIDVQSFKDVVITPFSAADRHGNVHGYASYLILPAGERTDDEADAVDARFTMKVLQWLGYGEGQFVYNRHQDSTYANRPDFVAHALVGTAFVWEDKRTGLDFDPEDHVKQLARYTAGTPGYAVWSNARRILAFRFDPNGSYVTLADVNIEGIFGAQRVFPDELARQESGLALFYLLFRRERFTKFDELVNSVCITEAEFMDSAAPLQNEKAQRGFINGAGQVLEHLRIAALSRLYAAVQHRISVDKRRVELHSEWEVETGKLQDRLTPALAEAIKVPLEAVSAKLGALDDGQVGAVFTAVHEAGQGRLGKIILKALEDWQERTGRVDAAMHAARLIAGSEIYIRDAFIVWKERQPDADLATFEVFAEQTAYVFFVRMLLARVLEDKRLIENRIASDGGFDRWREIVAFYFDESSVSIHAYSFIRLLAERVAMYYQHFFQQPVFDWFMPDDYLLVETLEFLSRYNFEDVQSDILGFTYEEYIDRVARNKKGHFLTRPPVVEYMLDLAGYHGPDVIGRRVLDPACGSGSFLVSAARRYRVALVAAVAGRAGIAADELTARSEDLRLEVATRYVDALTNLLYGMDLDPFSCYLAELNLFVCGLEDIHLLWKRGAFTAIERFHIYNTDSLDLPDSVLGSSIAQSSLAGEHELLREQPADYVAESVSVADELVDEGYPVKVKLADLSSGFYYVISNPPYITRKQHPELDARYRDKEFYAEALSGDMNTYLLFMRLGLYYLAVGGTICYIVPLTILGDRSASSIRRLMTDYLVKPMSVVRFYSGNVLFPGVDQATAIVCAAAGEAGRSTVVVGGGFTVEEAQESQREQALAQVASATPKDSPWFGAWLVSPSDQSYRIWHHVRTRSAACLSDVWEGFIPRQGDVNATYVKPFQVEHHTASDIPLYKGENVFPYAPLPAEPPAWVRIPRHKPAGGPQAGVYRVLESIRDLEQEETGVALREVARLNTRETLNATVFSRGPRKPVAFTHGVWRFVAKLDGKRSPYGLVALLDSRVTAYMLNMFSTNNNVLLTELGRIPTPPEVGLDTQSLSCFAEKATSVRADLEQRFVLRYGLKLPDKDERLYLPPSSVLANTSVPTVLLSDLELRKAIAIRRRAGDRVAKLVEADAFEITGSESFRKAVLLLLEEQSTENWSTIRRTLQGPEPSHATAFLRRYDSLSSEANRLWQEFQQIQRDIDDIIGDWYGLDGEMKAAIREGLPWACKRRA